MSKYFLAVTVGDVQKYVEVFETDFLHVVDEVSGTYTIEKRIEDRVSCCTTYYDANVGEKFSLPFGFIFDVK